MTQGASWGVSSAIFVLVGAWSANGAVDLLHSLAVLARQPAQQTLVAQRRLGMLVQAHRDRIIPIDRGGVGPTWGTNAKHIDDMALAATVRVRHLVLVTRNIAHFRGRDVEALDPFKRPPCIMSLWPFRACAEKASQALRAFVTVR